MRLARSETRERPPAPKPPSRPGWLFVMTAALLLLVWSFSPIWLSVLLTAFWLLAFAHGVSA